MKKHSGIIPKETLKLIKGAISKIVEIQPVGSRITCVPAPKNTDEDYLVLTRTRVSIVSKGWKLDNCGHYYALNEGLFDSWRYGQLNVILTDSREFYDKFLLSTKLAKKFNLLEKQDRISLFQAVLYNRDFDEVVLPENKEDL